MFNLVTGVGPVVGEAIAAPPRRRHGQLHRLHPGGQAGQPCWPAETVKRVALELGGKSANIILDDADLAEVVPKGVFACYLNSGQTCTAHTRMLVPKEKHDEAVAIAAAAAEGFPVGPADQDGVMLGPLSSAAQRDRVQDYIQKGIDEGATLATGGPETPEGLDTGYFVQPTVFGNVSNDMTIAQEEIFGPVLSIIPYEDEDDAVRIANDTQYGLAGGVWSADEDRARRGGPSHAHRPGRRQRRQLQHQGAVRWLQAVRRRS